MRLRYSKVDNASVLSLEQGRAFGRETGVIINGPRTTHLGTVCEKEGFDKRLGNLDEEKAKFIILRKRRTMSISFFL